MVQRSVLQAGLPSPLGPEMEGDGDMTEDSPLRAYLGEYDKQTPYPALVERVARAMLERLDGSNWERAGDASRACCRRDSQAVLAGLGIQR